MRSPRSPPEDRAPMTRPSAKRYVTCDHGSASSGRQTKSKPPPSSPACCATRTPSPSSSATAAGAGTSTPPRSAHRWLPGWPSTPTAPACGQTPHQLGADLAVSCLELASLTSPRGSLDDFATIGYHSVSGRRLWVHRYNRVGKGREFARAITVSSDGAVCLTGTSTVNSRGTAVRRNGASCGDLNDQCHDHADLRSGDRQPWPGGCGRVGVTLGRWFVHSAIRTVMVISAFDVSVEA